jgi:hypothetical protein
VVNQAGKRVWEWVAETQERESGMPEASSLS